MASSRFPGKPLALIAGLPMIEHVRRRALSSSLAGEVVVATCDVEIMEAITAAGGRATMTAHTHERCTSRVAEAASAIEADVYVIVQGDEPLLDHKLVDAVARPFLDDASVRCTNLLSPLDGDGERASPDVVKAAVAAENVLYFTRASIPYFREKLDVPVYRQTGIMALSAELLAEFDTLPMGPLERAESVDMLRLLENGVPIRAVIGDASTVGVDRPSDIQRVESILALAPAGATA